MANNVQDQILFTGGLDQDSDEKFVQQGDYVDALNIAKFYDGNAGLVTNANGNSEISNTYLPTGTNKCIGWCEDEESNAIIFFNYNSNNNHGIYRLLKDSDTFQKILHNESILAFSSDTVNLQAHVVGGKLYWNEGKDINGDYINVPRKINIERARRHTNGLGGDAYDDITINTLSAIKRPAIGNIYATLLEDASFGYNFLNATYYQFTFELVFDDNEKSVLSNRTNFVFTEVGGSENYVGIRFIYNNVGDTVNKINVYYKNSILSDFILGGTIDVDDPQNVYDSNNDSSISSNLVDGTYYFYRFYGKSGGAYYSGTSGKLFDSVPIYANSQIYTDNRMFYGGGELSYDKEDVNVTFESYSGDSGSLSGVSIMSFEDELYGGNISAGFRIYGLDDAIYNKLDIDYNVNIDVSFSANVSVYTTLDPIDYIYMTGSDIFQSTLEKSAIRDKIINEWTFKYTDDIGGEGDSYKIWELDGSDYVLTVYFSTQDSAYNETISTNLYSVVRNDDTYMLPGSYYQFCIYLFDDYFRTTGAIYNEDTKVFIPTASSMVDTEFTWGIEWTVNQYLPSWVRYVSFGYSKCLDFLNVWQIRTPTYDSGDRSFTIPSDYVYEDGDVLRIFGGDTVYDIESGDDTKIYMPLGFTYTSGSIEILRPNQIPNNSVFYEISALYNCESQQEGSVVIGNLQAFNGYFVGGDFNEYDAGSGYEGLSHLDSNDNLFYTFRRIIPELDDYGNIEYQTVYFSQKYFDNTKVNGLNSFDFSNKADLSDENGEIIDLKRVGEVLYVHQRREITSFYLGKTILKQSSAGEVTADTSQVLGGKRESSFGYGTTFKTARMDNNVYGFDIYKGVFWMNGYNGVQVISGKDVSGNYKMDSYFKDKAISLLNNGITNIRVLIGVDKPNDTIYVTFIDESDSGNNETIAYHRPTNRWISKYSFIPEQYAWLDDNMYSLKSGKLYKHDDASANKCTYYSTAYDSYIQFVSHESPNLIKVFNSIGIHADNQWTVDPIEIQPNANYPNGMYSKIIDSEFIKEDGVWRAAMPKNMKTRSSSATNYDRINGQDLRGYVVKCKLTNSDTDESKLFKVDINGVISK